MTCPDWMVLSRAGVRVVSVVDSDRGASATPEMTVVRPFAQERSPMGHRGGKLVWVASAAVLVTISGLAITFLNFRPSGSQRRTAVAPAPQNASLGLRIHVLGDDFLITWDRETPEIRSATKGVLRIQDGSQLRSTEMEPTELANGSIQYRPRSDDVDFLLTVYAADGAVTREGIRALDGTSRLSAAVAGDVPQLVTAATRRQFTGSRSGQSGVEPPKSMVSTLHSERLPQRGTAPDYIAPQPLKVVMLDVGRLAPESLPAQGRIEVEVEVDDQGRVTAARIPADAPRVSTEVAKAAITAAKQWRFEPAKLHGQSVASRHRVVFDIRSGSR